MEPDFGTSVVLSITAGAMMFVAGVPLFRFIFLAASGVATRYDCHRLAVPLAAFGITFGPLGRAVLQRLPTGAVVDRLCRGSWTGLGLGNSLQKLFGLPEAHTDFIFAIIAEEFRLNRRHSLNRRFFRLGLEGISR